MRCPECQASAAATDAHGWVVCVECGLVIELVGRLERDCAVLTHNSPISDAAPLGSSIDARGFEYSELVRQIRRADRYARRASTSIHDAGCQFMVLRAALDLYIPMVALMGRYDRISKKTRGISAKNLALWA